MPVKTMDAFRERGTVAQTVASDLGGAQVILEQVGRLGLDLPEVTAQLVEDGVKLFADAFDSLLSSVEAKRTELAEKTGA
jgi:transaldolase